MIYFKMKLGENLSQNPGQNLDLSNTDKETREFETITTPHFKQEIEKLISELRDLLKSVTSPDQLEKLHGYALVQAKLTACRENWKREEDINHDLPRAESAINKLVADKRIELSSANA